MADVAILLVTFGLTIFADLVVAVNVGVLLATLHFLRRMASSVDVEPLADTERQVRLKELSATEVPEDVLVYAINGPIFFAAVDTFERALASTHADPRALVLRLGRVPFIDFTGIQALEEIIEKLTGRGVDVVLCEANTRVKMKMERAGIINGHTSVRYAESLTDALELLTPEREPALV
jgi:SulP family sulfate permease